jgi:hypothetical protein
LAYYYGLQEEIIHRQMAKRKGGLGLIMRKGKNLRVLMIL